MRSTTLKAAGVAGEVRVAIKVDSHERRNMGLRMDRLRLDVSAGPALKLQLRAAARPVATILLLFVGLLAVGASPLLAGSLSLVGALLFLARALGDLFGAYRQTSLAPEMLVVTSIVLRAAKTWLEPHVGRKEAAWLAATGLVTMAFRLSLITHPDFYYPDLLTHARVVETIRNEGPSFFLHPDSALNAQGAWTKPVLGRVSSLPYAVMFHTPFAILAWLSDLSTDQIETLMKAGASLVSVVPIFLGALIAARLSLPPLAAVLLCVIPTYTSRLSVALLPALLGHDLDLGVLLALLMAVGSAGLSTSGGGWWTAAALLLGHLGYTASVVNEAVFVGVLAALWFSTGHPGVETGLRLLLVEALAALCAFGLYYRHFVGDVFHLLRRGLGLVSSGDAAASSVYPVESFWSVLFERSQAFFGWPWLSLALLGLAVSGPALVRSKLVQAWLLTYLALIFLRARIPDIFRYGHETLFFTPLVAILAGSALIAGWRRGGVWRLLSIAAGAALASVSFRQQWVALSAQLANAL